MKNPNPLIGRKVTINQTNDWGIIRMIDGDEYHVGLFGEEKTLMLFYRDEIRIPRKVNEDEKRIPAHTVPQR